MKYLALTSALILSTCGLAVSPAAASPSDVPKPIGFCLTNQGTTSNVISRDNRGYKTFSIRLVRVTDGYLIVTHGRDGGIHTIFRECF